MSTSLAALAGLTLAACRPMTPVEQAVELGLLASNGLAPDGLEQNGLASNFSRWFNEDVARSEAVMRFLVRCAAPAGQSRTWKNPASDVTYAWPGALGLAPGWAAGSPATKPEQQAISACVAAHVNKFGIPLARSAGRAPQASPYAWMRASSPPTP
ncbi:MAG TPA: hypothetical protein VFR85_03380 [Anaeromyxobacteraceae bacterium]|nr:hypothetical protein [Anaeromyxobacteraceae bacterium]